MHAIRLRKHLASPVIDAPELASLVGKDVEIIVLEESEPTVSAVLAGPKAGSAKGKQHDRAPTNAA